MGNLLASAQISRLDESIFVDKGNGTKVNYRIFPEFEVHGNTVDANTQQEWHHHTKIEETIYVTEGELVALWLEGETHHEETLHTGDVIRVGASVHTFANRTEQPASFVVFRFVPDGTDKREIIKNDRYADKVSEPAV
ncbi:hypothetical protein COY17_00920 [Candidatus Saccharibacteria bacterium CG_4_10_14_0_2_um_filter_52_9]|nr:MAG: hypothetical protein COY17_00920 [Candidatus Saccharibacteria bacterium CG_4_10_14_0_2_um_filter_52_9]